MTRFLQGDGGLILPQIMLALFGLAETAFGLRRGGNPPVSSR